MEPVEPTSRELYELAVKALNALSEAMAMNRELVRARQETVADWSRTDTHHPAPGDSPRYRPQNKELREYDTFRRYYQHLERVARRDLQLPDDVEVTKEMIYRAGGPSLKTTTRIMTRTHGLLADQWPPSSWPDRP